MTVHPDIRQPCAVARLALRDFVGVMDRDMIFTPAVNIKESTQVFDRHRGAFGMPARKGDPPRAVPFHLPLPVSRAKFPQRKIGGSALLAHIDTAPRPQALDVE